MLRSRLCKGSALDGRTTGQAGYTVSQVIRKRIEDAFGWMKASAGLRKTRHRGLGRVGWQLTLTMAAYTLIRLPDPRNWPTPTAQTDRPTATPTNPDARSQPTQDAIRWFFPQPARSCQLLTRPE